MKKILILLLLVGAGAWIWRRFGFSGQDTDLNLHLADAKVKDQVGKVAMAASLDAKPAQQTVSARGPMDVALLNVFQKMTPNTPVWLLN